MRAWFDRRTSVGCLLTGLVRELVEEVPLLDEILAAWVKHAVARESNSRRPVSRQDEPDHPPRRTDEPSRRPDDPRTHRL